MMKMPSIAVFALTALLPLAAAADPAAGPPPGGPPPEMRAQFEKNRADAKVAAFGVLSPDHRAQVQAIVDRVNAGTLTDPLDANKQIDAILTPDEVKAVLVQREKFGASMHRGMGVPPSGAPMPAMHAGMGDAGHYLLRLAVSSEKMHALMRSHGGAAMH